jgi:hypothetical protein
MTLYVYIKGMGRILLLALHFKLKLDTCLIERDFIGHGGRCALPTLEVG